MFNHRDVLNLGLSWVSWDVVRVLLTLTLKMSLNDCGSQMDQIRQIAGDLYDNGEFYHNINKDVPCPCWSKKQVILNERNVVSNFLTFIHKWQPRLTEKKYSVMGSLCHPLWGHAPTSLKDRHALSFKKC